MSLAAPSPSPVTSPGNGTGIAPARRGATRNVLKGLRCTPSRRSVKFAASPHARQFLAFDTAISREERLLLFMELFVFRQQLVDATVLPAFHVASYTPEELLEIRVVTDPRHPAYGQAGLYAKSAIPHNTIVTPYSGFIEIFATSCNSRTYTMGFGSIGDDYALDAEFVGNYGRFANDPRGVGALQANLSAENRFNSRGESFTALVTRRLISPGEEILMSYGKAHRLSATPWTTMRGEPLMRPRLGGVIPFPAFRTEERDTVGEKKGATATSSLSRGARLACTPEEDDHSAAPRNESQSEASSNLEAKKHGNNSESSNGDNNSEVGAVSVANDLLWECTQCGMWNLCDASLTDTPLECSACATPKLSGARFVSLLSSPAVTQTQLLREAGIDVPGQEADDVAPQTSSGASASPAWPEALASATPTTKDTAAPPSLSSSPASLSSAAAAVPTVSPFTSKPTEWPMSVPFLPWQVWDAAVPLTVLEKHSKFETQEHMFLYSVDTGLQEEDEDEDRGRRRRRSIGGVVRYQKHDEQDRPKKVRTEKNAVGAEVAGGDGRGDAPESGDVAESVDAPAPPTGTSVNGVVRSIDLHPTGSEASRLRRNGLWEPSVDLGASAVTEASAKLDSPASSSTPTREATASSPTSKPASVALAPFTKQEANLPSPTFTSDTSSVASTSRATAPSTCRTTAVQSPLSSLLSPTREVDRLLLLAPCPRNQALASTAATTKTTAASLSIKSDKDALLYSPAVLRMRQRLQCMTRRLFTGKAFQAGEVVSNIGGLVRYRYDPRCRVANSCLEIPLKFFLPLALRKLCARSESVKAAIVDQDAKQPNKAGDALRSAGEEREEAGESSEMVMLRRFCERFDRFSFVVTNEFMYCPCLVTDSEKNEGDSDDDDGTSALEACNVALVLTLDSLGCPYACAVATRPIRAFEPLLARAHVATFNMPSSPSTPPPPAASSSSDATATGTAARPVTPPPSIVDAGNSKSTSKEKTNEHSSGGNSRPGSASGGRASSNAVASPTHGNPKKSKGASSANSSNNNTSNSADATAATAAAAAKAENASTSLAAGTQSDANNDNGNINGASITNSATTAEYPAASCGVSNPAHSFATSLLNLEVKVLTQALGAENQWVEQGDGRVSFCDFTIRVTALRTRKDDGAVKDKASAPSATPASTADTDTSSPGITGTEGSASSTAANGTSMPESDAKQQQQPSKSEPKAVAEASTLSDTVSDVDEDEDENEVIILEDTISNDTPFVGENCCIVWNSFEKQLSLCLMYASEEGYSASWSALVALQDKSYPAFRYDLLERCRPASERTVVAMNDSQSSTNPSTATTATNTNATPTTGNEKAEDVVVLPYSYFIHERHDPPLGFIEQHALSLSIMEHHHTLNPALYADEETVVVMLNIANADLLDNLISDAVFPLLLTGLKCGADPTQWVVPEQLRSLHVPQDVISSVAKDRRITFLLESVLPTCCSGETKIELIAKYTTLSRRIRNDIVCGLLTCDAVFTEASEALRVAPPAMTGNTGNNNGGTGAPRSRLNSGDAASSLPSTASLMSANPAAAAGLPPSSPITSTPSSAAFAPPVVPDALAQAQKAEQQVLAHLRFFRELVTLSISELGREMVGPIVGKVFQCELLQSLSLVAERFAMPANMATAFLKRLADNSNGAGTLNGHRRNNNGGAAPSSAGGGANSSGTGSVTSGGGNTNFYSPAVEQELAALLDVTLVRINERQEEQLMNDHVRSPILADPLKYNGLVTFMVRQLVVTGTAVGSSGASNGGGNRSATGGLLSVPKRIMRDNMSTCNPFVLFHVLGLHDDEGSAAAERVLDVESTTVRNHFHNFIITKYLAHAARGIMPPVPLPPSIGGVGATRNTPIVRFDNASAALQGGPVRGSQHDGIEGSTSSTAIGVPNTGVGIGSSSTGGGAGAGGGAAAGTLLNGGLNPSPAVAPLPQGVTPALVRVLEYLVALANRPNRELLLKTVFHPKSHILHFMESVCDTLCSGDGTGGRCVVGLDVLCGCVRFLKVVVTQMAISVAEHDENPLPTYATTTAEPLPAAQTTAICRQLTVERDTFGSLLKAYNRLGGVRRNTVFHSGLLAVLDIISKGAAKESVETSANTLRDVRDYLFYKHLTRLPTVFARRFREELLDEVGVRLGRESSLHSPNESVSVLSSTAGSELARSSSKLRFVDEVEAVAGGVDGTVIPSTVMNPAIVANMASAEEKQRKRNVRNSMDQWTATATHVLNSPSPVRAVTPLTLADEHGGLRSPPPPLPSARTSPPMTISITRPNGANSSNSSASSSTARTPPSDAALKPAGTSPVVSPLASAEEVTPDVAASAPGGNVGAPSNSSPKGSNGVLKPTAPKNEKPPGRPRNFASVLDAANKSGESGGNTGSGSSGGGKSRSMPNITTGTYSPPPATEEVRSTKAGTNTIHHGSNSNNGSVPMTLARANSIGEGGAASNGSPLSTDNVILPKIKKRGSQSGKRT